jgi:hypothetical protein
MDVIIASNQESPILTSLERNLVEDPYSYRLAANFPNQSKSLVTVQPQYAAAGTSHGADLHFKLPRYGLVAKMVLRNKMISSGPQDDVKARLGERVYSRLELRSHNKVIQSQNPEYCQARIDNLGQEANNSYTSVTQTVPVVSSWTNGVEAECFTPVFFSFFEKTSNFLDLSFIEELELVATVGTQTSMGLENPLASGQYELLVWYVNLSEEAEQAYIAKNFPASQPLTMLAYDMYPETPKIETSDGLGSTVITTTVDLKTNNAVYATHFIIKNEDKLQDTMPITSFQLNAVGRELMAQDARVNVFDTGSYGVSGCTSSAIPGAGNITYNAGSRVLTYFYGMSKDRTYNSGATAYKNLNNPQAVITWTDTGVISEKIKVYVVHEYLNLVTINPSDGSINRGLSD